MPRVWLFVVTCVFGGLGAAIGSVIGHAFGTRGLFTFALLFGLAAVALGARFAVWRHWIEQSQWPATALGAGLGFLAAAFIATRTLSSPVGPILSALLIGAGAVLGARAAEQPPRGPVV
jgi:hypothetical protein